MKDSERYKTAWDMPYMKTTAIKWLEKCNQMKRPGENGRELDFERVNEILLSLVSVAETDLHKTDCETIHGIIISQLEKLKQEIPDAYVETLALVEWAALLGWTAAESILISNHLDQVKKFNPIKSANSAKNHLVARAKSIAAELWQADADQIRIGVMADKVYRKLADEGFADSLPETAEPIKDWIKPVAPDYARKGGRRRKTP